MINTFRIIEILSNRELFTTKDNYSLLYHVGSKRNSKQEGAYKA